MLNIRLAEAYDAYCNGQEAKAAELNREVAELAAQNGDTAIEQHARRWQGNSLMWCGRHEEAFRVLTQAASYDKPDADPESVYGAKTDRILLSLFPRVRRALPRTPSRRPRLPRPDRQTPMVASGRNAGGILFFVQGDYAQAAEFAIRAIRLVEHRIDGAAYSDAAM